MGVHSPQKTTLRKYVPMPHICGGSATFCHYNDVIMDAMASQITSLNIVYSAVYSGTDHRKHQSSASLAFVRGIHRGPVNSPQKWPVTRKMVPLGDVIMYWGSVTIWFEKSLDRKLTWKWLIWYLHYGYLQVNLRKLFFCVFTYSRECHAPHNAMPHMSFRYERRRLSDDTLRWDPFGKYAKCRTE